jgi:DNA invertase Pin-like site-specific DNA recombinase
LGWPENAIEVVDEDQGCSGASVEGRGGFQQLVSDVALGKVGAVLGLEVSRLARSCVDWYRLLEVAALSGALIVDEEGVYDPNHYNDRLLLGLKGTLSEAELHFLKQRMVGGRRTKARRGEFRIRLPAGYVWDEEKKILMDPDEQVRNAVNLLFRSFKRIGTALGTARYFETNCQQFPRRDGWGNLNVPVAWGRLSLSRVVEVLKNPVYAGIYPYDRKNRNLENPEDGCSGGRIWIPDSHPGYINEAEYHQNVAQLESNRVIWWDMRRKGSVRKGNSLLQGIVLCGVCGHHMHVQYDKGQRVCYTCFTSDTRRMCQHVNGRYVDSLIEQVLLETLNQQEFELSLHALEKIEARSRELEKQWQQKIEAAQYEAEKAARRYYRVEPENRLVARTLEKEWNQKLEEVEGLKQHYMKFCEEPPFSLCQEQKEEIMALSQDLPRLWKAKTTKNSQRKQILRMLVEDVTLTNKEDPWCVHVVIHWKTGTASFHQADRVAYRPYKTSPEVVGRIQKLYQEHTDKEIAQILNEEGFKPGYSPLFNAVVVRKIRSKNQLFKYKMGKSPDQTRQGRIYES